MDFPFEIGFLGR